MKEIIHQLLIDNWDSLAFAIAVIALYYAIKTFKSQKQTADNTTPTINEDIQKFLLQKMFVNLLDAYTNIVVHERIIEENINLNRSEEITANQVIPENMIHLELFYGQNNEGHKDDVLFQKTKNKFQKLNALDESIRNYNMNLVILRGQIHDRIFDSHRIILDRLERLRYKCQIIIMQWKMAMIELYEDDNIIKTVENDLFIKDSIEHDDSYLADRYGFGDKLISYLLIKDKELFDTLIIFMNQRAEIFEKEQSVFICI